MKPEKYQITEFCHRIVKPHIEPGDLCIDATVGNGNDTVFLCGETGPEGRVLGFDIQETAIRNTENRLCGALPEYRNWELHLCSHEDMGQFAGKDSVSCILFNLGYLPAGDHTLSTRAETTIPAVLEGLKLLKPGGIMGICIYSGGDSGFEEREKILPVLKSLDPRRYLVITAEYANRPNDPPLPVFVIDMRR